MKCTFQHHRFSHLVVTAMLVSCTLALEAQGVSPPPDGAVSYEELFEKAVFTEESLGDLDGAIALYQALLESAKEDRAFVAQAQYRLGLCYLKQGNQDAAVTTLQSLIEEFPGQKQVVNEARVRLSKLGYPVAQEELSLRMIWTNAGGSLGAPSADGRFLSFTDWTTGDVAVHDLATGQDRRVTNKGSWESPSFAEFSVPSPDGKRIAYAWFVGPDLLYDLRVIDVDGSNMRVVFKDEAVPWLQPLEWSSDGSAIFAELSYSEGGQLAWVDVETGNIQAVGPRRKYTQGKFDLSPDEQWIVFAQEQEEGSTARDIYLRNASSGEDSVFMKHPADDRVVGWSPDGNQLIFLSDRSGEWAMWAQPVASGKIAGEPRLIKAGMGQLWPNGQLFPMGFTDDGSLYYGLTDQMSDIYLADLQQGSADGAPVKLTRRFEGTNMSPEWSSDGSYLAWISRRGGAYTIVIRDVKSGEERDVDVSSKLTRIFGRGWGGIRWSPDSRSVLVAGMAKPMDSWMGLFSIDVETGDIEQIAAAGNHAIRVPVWAPDGKTLYYTEIDRITARDMETGTDTILYTGNVGNIALSPDGRELAFTTDAYTGAKEHQLKILLLDGDEARVVYRSSDSEPFMPTTSLAWSPDGQHLIFSTGRNPNNNSEDVEVALWRISVRGGKRESLGIRMPYLARARLHPDGHRLVFQAGARKHEVWVMENFIPPSMANR